LEQYIIADKERNVKENNS